MTGRKGRAGGEREGGGKESGTVEGVVTRVICVKQYKEEVRNLCESPCRFYILRFVDRLFLFLCRGRDCCGRCVRYFTGPGGHTSTSLPVRSTRLSRCDSRVGRLPYVGVSDLPSPLPRPPIASPPIPPKMCLVGTTD